MKRLNYLTLFVLCFLLQNTFAQTQWTFYNDAYYKGYQKKYDSGEMKASHQWKWNSWKSDCCTLLYYYSKDGKVHEKKLCGDVQDFGAELKKWEDLKYGHQQGWKNIQKIHLYCDDVKYAKNNTENNYNTRNNHKNYDNNQDYQKKQEYQKKEEYHEKGDYASMDWYKYYGKGNVIFAEEYNYGGKYKARATGSQDYRSLQFYPRSILLSKSGRYIVMEYRDNYNKSKSVVLKEDVPDLKTYMSNLKIEPKYHEEPYKAIIKFTIMRY